MSEGQSPDITEPKKAYEEGLKVYLQTVAQPTSFLEHPATRMIPIIGPILSIFGQVSRQQRFNQAAIQSSEFNDLAKSGDLSPAHAARFQNIPLPIFQSGLLESQKIQKTYGYQERQALGQYLEGQKQQETFQSLADPESGAKNLQNFLTKYPSLAAAGGVPEAGRIAMEKQMNDLALQRINRTGQQGVQRQDQQITSTPLPTQQIPTQQTYIPPTTSTNTPLSDRLNNPLNIKYGGATKHLLDQGVATLGPKATDGGNFLHFTSQEEGYKAAGALLTGPNYKDLSVQDALKKWSGKGYGGEIVAKQGIDPSKKIKDLSPNERAILVSQMAQIEGGPQSTASRGVQQQNGQIPQALDAITPGTPAPYSNPQGDFDPRILPTVPGKETVTMGGGKATIAQEELSPQEKATAYLQHRVMQDPRNYQAAIQSVTRSGIPIDLTKFEPMKQEAGVRLFGQEYQKAQLEGLDQIKAAQRAYQRVAQSLNIAVDPQVVQNFVDPAFRARVIQEAQTQGTGIGQQSPEAIGGRQAIGRDEAIAAGLRERELGRVRADVPIEQLPNFPEIVQRFPGIDPKSTLSSMGRSLGIPYDENFMKRSTATENAYSAIDQLEKYFNATGPARNPITQAFVALQRRFTPGALQVPVRTYDDMRKGLVTLLAAVAGESGGRYTDKDAQNWLSILPRDENDKKDAGQRFNFVKEQITRPHFSELDYRSPERKVPLQKEYQEQRGKNPTQNEKKDKTPEELVDEYNKSKGK